MISKRELKKPRWRPQRELKNIRFNKQNNSFARAAHFLYTSGPGCSNVGWRYPPDESDPADSVIDFPNTYLLDSDLSGG